MTIDEFNLRMHNINRRFEIDKSSLYKAYAFDNNPYVVGDIFTDHIGSIKIEAIGVDISYGASSCTYTGLELKKDGTPVKKLTKRTAYQTNDIKNLKITNT